MQLHRADRTVEVDLVIFDKDGTLVDLHTLWGGWAEQVAAALASHIPPPLLLSRLGWDERAHRIRPETPLAIASVDALQSVVATWLYEAGLGWSTAVAAATGAIATATAALEAGDGLVAAPLCPLGPLFAWLRAGGAQIAIVTTDTRAGVERDLGAAGVLGAVRAIVAADSGVALKPAPEAVLAACAMSGSDPARAIVVGDSVADLLMGRGAGVALVVGVLSGSGDAPTLAPHADLLLPTVCALASPIGPEVK